MQLPIVMVHAVWLYTCIVFWFNLTCYLTILSDFSSILVYLGFIYQFYFYAENVTQIFFSQNNENGYDTFHPESFRMFCKYCTHLL